MLYVSSVIWELDTDSDGFSGLCYSKDRDLIFSLISSVLKHADRFYSVKYKCEIIATFWWSLKMFFSK